MTATRVDFVVAQGKKELRRVAMQVEHDEIVPVAAGEQADITFTMTEQDAQALSSGDLDLSVGFMRGQIKMAGDFGRLLHFLPLTSGHPLKV
jgi:putative sterol carrier protein